MGNAVELGGMDHRGEVVGMRLVRMVEHAGAAMTRSRSHAVIAVGMSVWHVGTAMHRVHLRHLGYGR